MEDIDDNDNDDFRELTVRDHLDALGYSDKWMEMLAEMIIEFTGNDVAIAVTRALDLGTNARFGKAVSFMIKGYLEVSKELENGLYLTPNQRETMRRLLRGTSERMMKFFPEMQN